MAAVTVTFTVDQSLLDLYTPAACALYGYQATIPDPAHPGQTLPNPQTPAQFAAQRIIQYAVDVAKSYAAKQADAARVTALAQVDAAVSAAPPSFTISP